MQHFGKVPLLLLEHGPVHQRVPLPTAVGGPRSNLRAVEGSELHLYPITERSSEAVSRLPRLLSERNPERKRDFQIVTDLVANHAQSRAERGGAKNDERGQKGHTNSIPDRASSAAACRERDTTYGASPEVAPCAAFSRIGEVDSENIWTGLDGRKIIPRRNSASGFSRELLVCCSSGGVEASGSSLKCRWSTQNV